MADLPVYEDVARARETLGDRVKVTPMLTSASISGLTGTNLVLKAENLQRTGSFKVRGALNRLSALSSRERETGVIAASAGNHGQAVAWAGRTPAGYTIADGIAVKQPGELTQAILDSRLSEVRTVSDEQVAEAILLVLERSKLLVEGAGAAALASLLDTSRAPKGRTCVVLSGGNIDPSVLLSVVRAGLTRAGRYLILRIRVPDRPGHLSRVLACVAEHQGNLVTVFHQREAREDLGILETDIDLTILARDAAHSDAILAALAELGIKIERLN